MNENKFITQTLEENNKDNHINVLKDSYFKNKRNILLALTLGGVLFTVMAFQYNNSNRDSDSNPDITPQLSPTIQQELTGAPTGASNYIEKFTNEYFPGFSVEYDSKEWDLLVKPFNVDDNMGFTSLYKPSCDVRCMGLRFKRNDVSLDVIFHIAFDDSRSRRCSNSIQNSAVGSNWYQLQDISGIYYSYNFEDQNKIGLELNYSTTEDSCAQFNEYSQQIISTYGNQWSCDANSFYEVCDSGTGIFLNQFSSIEAGADGSGVPILMEKPKISGNPDPITLKKIDEIVSSIKFDAVD